MDTVDPGSDIPATERALVGLCHGLNDQLAALNAYVFLLDRRGALEERAEPFRAHLDRLAHQVRLVRALARDPSPEVSPVAVSLLAEAATDIMDGYPEGPVVFERVGEDGAVVRCDWSRALRALLIAGAWITRDSPASRVVTVEGRGRDKIRVQGLEGDTITEGGRLTAPSDDDYGLEVVGPESVEIDLG